ncbi:MAG: MFS transporter [Opitutales bacterium]|nr:MFS transporter [Opitutales bacterium]
MAAQLRRRTKAGFGLADFGLSSAELLIQFYLFDFYTRVVGLRADLAGYALALAVVWDAVSDPLMGMVTDRTRSRFGSFLPYLVAGAVSLPLALWALFSPPALSGQGAGFLYLLFTYVLVNTSMTVIGVPHLALGGALTEDSNERTEVYGWRLVAGTFGLFFGILAPLLAADSFGLDVDSDDGVWWSRSLAALFVGGAVIASAGATIFAVRRRAMEARVPVGAAFSLGSLAASLRGVFANRFFLPVLFAFVIASVGRAMNATLALPYYRFRLELAEADVQRWVLGIFAVAIVASVAVWIPLGRRFGKKWPGFAGMLALGIMTAVAYPLFPAGSLAGPAVMAVFGGIAVGAIILFESLVTDVADADRLETGEQRAGLYFGFWRLGQKLARSVGLGLTGPMLALIGFEEGVREQSAETALGLALFFGPGVGLCFILAAVVFAFSPMDRREQARVQRRLEARRGKSGG